MLLQLRTLSNGILIAKRAFLQLVSKKLLFLKVTCVELVVIQEILMGLVRDLLRCDERGSCILLSRIYVRRRYVVSITHRLLIVFFLK